MYVDREQSIVVDPGIVEIWCGGNLPGRRWRGTERPRHPYYEHREVEGGRLLELMAWAEVGLSHRSQTNCINHAVM